MNSVSRKFEDFYRTRTEREKILLLIVSIAFIYFIFSNFFLTSATQNLNDVTNKFSLQSDEVEKNRLKDKSLSEKLNDLQNTNIAGVISEFNERIELLDKQINEISTAISSPEKIVSFIHDLFYSHDDIYLSSIKNSLPVREESMSDLFGRNIYLHNITLEMRGSFDSIIDFLENIEEKKPDIAAHSLRIEIHEYPEVKAIISYHLYSFKKEIIGA